MLTFLLAYTVISLLTLITFFVWQDTDHAALHRFFSKGIIRRIVSVILAIPSMLILWLVFALHYAYHELLGGNWRKTQQAQDDLWEVTTLFTHDIPKFISGREYR